MSEEAMNEELAGEVLRAEIIEALVAAQHASGLGWWCVGGETEAYRARLFGNHTVELRVCKQSEDLTLLALGPGFHPMEMWVVSTDTEDIYQDLLRLVMAAQKHCEEAGQAAVREFLDSVRAVAAPVEPEETGPPMRDDTVKNKRLEAILECLARAHRDGRLRWKAPQGVNTNGAVYSPLGDTGYGVALRAEGDAETGDAVTLVAMDGKTTIEEWPGLSRRAANLLAIARVEAERRADQDREADLEAWSGCLKAVAAGEEG
jgi:hypothetical protein